MDITMQILFVESTNHIPDERSRKKRGTVVMLSDSSLITDETGYLKEPIAMNRPFAFIHVRGYPIQSIEPMQLFLKQSVEDENGLPVRAAKWLVDLDSMQPETIAALEIHRQIIIDWFPQNAAILRRLNVPDIQDAGQDSLAEPATPEILPSG